jgi:hypothetical protein
MRLQITPEPLMMEPSLQLVILERITLCRTCRLPSSLLQVASASAAVSPSHGVRSKSVE